MTFRAPEPDPRRSSVAYRGPFVRSLFTSGWDIAFESADATWVTVELSDDYRAVGTASGKKVDGVAMIGGVHVNPAGLPINLSIRGNYRAVQLAVPLALSSAMAEEDHELDGSKVEFLPVISQRDEPLARLLYRAATRPTEEAEDPGLLRAVVAHLLLHHSTRAPKSDRRCRAGISPTQLRRVVDFVEANLHCLSVEAMAATAGLSPFHFGREFKRTTGETPWRYVTGRRLARATALLGDPEAPLDGIARAVGFADASHLTHRMRQQMGCTPTLVRRHLLV
jgi:AraC family transcriptional regulator